MTTFAMIFMLTSMTAVTTLAGYCLYRILTGDSSDHDGASESEG